MDYNQELKVVQDIIKELVNSEKFKELKIKNRAWAMPKPTEAEKGEWQELKEELAKLENMRRILSAILSTNPAAVRKSDAVRKSYKEETAIKRERQFLTHMAKFLCRNYVFQTQYEIPSFGDAIRATGFHDDKIVSDYFRAHQKNLAEEDMRHAFSANEWIYMIDLSKHVNHHLHSDLPWNKNGQLEMVLETDRYKKDLVRGLLKKANPDSEADIKAADSNSELTVSSIINFTNDFYSI